MRVKIGPYKNWIGPYQIAEKILFFIPKKKDEYGFPHSHPLVHKFGEWLSYGSIKEKQKCFSLKETREPTLLLKLCQWIESKRKRKVEIRIDPWDTWSMHSTLSLIFVPLLKQLKETKHGSPYTDDADVPEHLRSTNAAPKENEYDVDEFHEARWDWIMDEMIWAFEQNNTDWEGQFYSGEIDTYFERIEGENFSEMKHGPKHTFEVDKEGLEKHQARMDNGFRLFGKYYQGLWD